MAALLTDGYETGVPALRGALELLATEELPTREATVRWLLLVPVALEAFIHYAWDLHAWDTLSNRAVRLARDIGALGALPPALVYAGGVHIHYGDFAEADRMIDEADALAAATGHAPHKYATLVLAAWRGEADVASGIIEEARQRADQRGEVSLLGAMGYIQGVLYNGLARYEEALEAARTGIEHDGFNFAGLSLIEHIEAATRCGELDQARASLARLVDLTRAADSGWAAAPRPVAGPSSPTARRPTVSTVRRSWSSSAAASPWRWPEATCCTASGCAAPTSDRWPASTCVRLTRCSTACGRTPSPSGPAVSCSPPGSTSGCGRPR